MGELNSRPCKLLGDMLEQFKGKPGITVLIRALARQLDDLRRFYEELNTRRWVDSAEGAQLDGIGSIAVLSRAEALAVSRMAEQNIPMDDELYRLYLKWKIALNTTDCTHSDRHRALKMFWGQAPIYYSEKPEHPATIFLTIPKELTTSEAALFRVASKIKAAGVALHFIFSEDVYEAIDYSFAYTGDIISEYYVEEVEVCTMASSLSGVACYEYVKEEYKEDG